MALHCTVLVWAADSLAVRAEQHLKVKELDQQPLANKTPVKGKRISTQRRAHTYIRTYECTYIHTYTSGKAVLHLTAEACIKQSIVRTHT